MHAVFILVKQEMEIGFSASELVALPVPPKKGEVSSK